MRYIRGVTPPVRVSLSPFPIRGLGGGQGLLFEAGLAALHVFAQTADTPLLLCEAASTFLALRNATVVYERGVRVAGDCTERVAGQCKAGSVVLGAAQKGAQMRADPRRACSPETHQAAAMRVLCLRRARATAGGQWPGVPPCMLLHRWQRHDNAVHSSDLDLALAQTRDMNER